MLVNWFISKEGQLALHAATSTPVAHKDLQRRELLPWPNEIVGRELAVRTPELLVDEYPKLIPLWNAAWRKSSGEKEEMTVSARLEAVNKDGREVVFVAAGKKEGAGISATRTKLSIAGKPARRTDLKPGMTCDITYSGNGSEAKVVSCK